MGVIEWRELPTYADEILQFGSFGGVDVCSVVFRADQWQLLLFHSFPGGQGRIWDAPVPCFSQADAQTIAESVLEEFLEEIGFVPKSELDDATAKYSGLYADFSARVDHSIDLAKDLRWSQAEIDRLKREIKQLNWELVNAKRERDVTEARYEALRPPKQRTEADFRNADIDANGYVTFRDGGAA